MQLKSKRNNKLEINENHIKDSKHLETLLKNHWTALERNRKSFGIIKNHWKNNRELLNIIEEHGKAKGKSAEQSHWK